MIILRSLYLRMISNTNFKLVLEISKEKFDRSVYIDVIFIYPWTEGKQWASEENAV
jgi:hypothetical protein